MLERLGGRITNRGSRSQPPHSRQQLNLSRCASLLACLLASSSRGPKTAPDTIEPGSRRTAPSSDFEAQNEMTSATPTAPVRRNDSPGPPSSAPQFLRRAPSSRFLEAWWPLRRPGLQLLGSCRVQSAAPGLTDAGTSGGRGERM